MLMWFAENRESWRSGVILCPPYWTEFNACAGWLSGGGGFGRSGISGCACMPASVAEEDRRNFTGVTKLARPRHTVPYDLWITGDLDFEVDR
jgi:hypothetical protein